MRSPDLPQTAVVVASRTARRGRAGGQPLRPAACPEPGNARLPPCPGGCSVTPHAAEADRRLVLPRMDERRASGYELSPRDSVGSGTAVEV